MLGCTHYPLLKEVIGAFMGPDVALVDVGVECAKYVARRLDDLGLLNDAGEEKPPRFFVSDDTGDFVRLASLFLGGDVAHAVEQADVSVYPG